ncbi:MAG: hypothetical protein RLZZ299_386 [Pseudomonadota bacterium]
MPAFVAGGLAPVAELALRGALGGLGADPVAFVLHRLGLAALIFLVAGLACTPLRAWLGWTWPLRVRRALGLLAFGYAAAHVAVYAGVDQGLDARAIVKDVTERPFVTLGAAAFALLVPLAWTSTDGAVRRMGGRRWATLHRWVYPAAVLAALHFLLRVKRDVTEPAVYGGVLALLLLLRGARRPSRRASGAGDGPPTG